MSISFFIDNDECEWVRNADGTFRCLNAELRSMTLEAVGREFGIDPDSVKF